MKLKAVHRPLDIDVDKMYLVNKILVKFMATDSPGWLRGRVLVVDTDRGWSAVAQTVLEPRKDIFIKVVRNKAGDAYVFNDIYHNVNEAPKDWISQSIRRKQIAIYQLEDFIKEHKRDISLLEALDK